MDISSKVVGEIETGKLEINSLREETLQDSLEISYIESPISYEEFFTRHLLPNRPCLLGGWATSGWQSRLEWVTPDGRPNTDYLRQKFGQTVVPVANCDQEEFSAHCKQDIVLEDYLNYLEKKNDASEEESRCLYLKDWHFTRAHPDYEAYQTPVFFQSDWLNEFWDGRSDEHDDYRFVYFGPKGSWTPFHADVLRSYSWSANICGKKLWWLYPPGEEEKLKDKFGQLAYDLRSDDLEDATRFPRASQCGGRMEVMQCAGEVIFVPSGWHHQVFNLEDTVSINHNWLNACSVDLSWAYVKACLREVQREINDCRDMEGWSAQCQLILKANNGIDYMEFYRFIHFIATNRIQKLEEVREQKQDILNPELNITPSGRSKQDKQGAYQERKNPSQSGYTHHSGEPHIIFDLMRISHLLRNMLDTDEFRELDVSTLDEAPDALCERVGLYL